MGLGIWILKEILIIADLDPQTYELPNHGFGARFTAPDIVSSYGSDLDVQ